MDHDHDSKPHRKPHDHPDMDERRAATQASAAAQITSADPRASHPVAGIPVDAAGFLAFLRAGVFSPVQLSYLHSGALEQYAAAAAAGGLMARDILDAWARALAEHPPAGGDPFNP